MGEAVPDRAAPSGPAPDPWAVLQEIHDLARVSYAEGAMRGDGGSFRNFQQIVNIVRRANKARAAPSGPADDWNDCPLCRSEPCVCGRPRAAPSGPAPSYAAVQAAWDADIASAKVKSILRWPYRLRGMLAAAYAVDLAPVQAEVERLKAKLKLHAGDTLSLSGELDDWRERACEAEAALDELRATPAEPGASPPEALVEKWAALATSGDGRHPEAAETLARCAAELKGALAARSPAPAGDAPTCSECHGSGRTDSHVTGEVECSHCDGCGEDPAGDAPTAVVVAQGPVNADRIDWTNTAGDAPREDALRERDRMWSKAILAEGAEAINRITTRLLVLRAAVSPSPGTRAASEGEA
jgi:hypothetical protein